jgi:peptide/nickel transport system permease protein
MTAASAASPPLPAPDPPAVDPDGGLRRRRRAQRPAWLLSLGTLIVFVLLAVVGPLITPYPPLDVGVGDRLAGPDTTHWFGTDNLGRDVFSRVIAGIRTSLIVGLGAAALATGVGTAVGSIAGYRSGLVDAVLMRGAEVVMIVPAFFLAVVLGVLFGASTTTMIIVIGILGWPVVSRVVRAEVLSLKGRVFVSAARTIGVGDAGLVLREILPNAAGRIAVVGGAQVAYAILLEASLSYLGLGDANSVSLGLMLQEAQPFLRSAPWMALFPALALFAMILCVNVAADEAARDNRAEQGRRMSWPWRPDRAARGGRA